MRKKGFFVTFEGAEGAGKSTAMRHIGAWLEQQGLDVVYTREPGGSVFGKELRAILLDMRNSSIVPRAELFLYLADRAQHVDDVIRPALQRGAVVLSDRFADSTMVYQGHGRGLDMDMLDNLNAVAVDGLLPDMTLLFDVNAAVGLERALARNAREGKGVSEGRFEAESIAFHNRIRQGFLALAAKHPERFRLIDACVGEDAVAAQAREAVLPLLDIPARLRCK